MMEATRCMLLWMLEVVAEVEEVMRRMLLCMMEATRCMLICMLRR